MRVIVSGAASGIGRATAVCLREAGALVLALDLKDPGAAADDWVPIDLADPSAVDALTVPRDCEALVNAAGLPPRPGDEARVLALNFLGLRRLTERLLPRLAPGASIVNVASKAGARWRENLDQVRGLSAIDDPGALPDFILRERIDPVRAYDLSKEAVIWWTRSETARLGRLKLRANAVSPAAVDTPILAEFEAAFGARASRGIAMTGRPGTAEEVARVVAFLASADSGWVRGANLPVDGGLDAMLETEALAT